MSEASGLAISRNYPGCIWSHNDSGNGSNIFLIDTATATIKVQVNLRNIPNVDWEDMAIGPGPREGKWHLYLADTGDNLERRKSYSIYRFEEPEGFTLNETTQLIWLDSLDFDRIHFIYPDGSHDVEACLVDPATSDIYLVSKRDVTSQVYVLPYPQTITNGSYATCYHVGSLPFKEVTAGDISPDGSLIVLKTYREILVWKSVPHEPVFETLSGIPQKLPYIGEFQGEAICFDEHLNYFTLSEAQSQSIKPNLYQYHPKNSNHP